MNNKYLVLIIIALLFSASCEKTEVKNANVKPTNAVTQTAATPIADPTIPKDGNYNSKGKVTKINTELGSIELDHEKIVGLMEAMIMEFYVKDISLLNEVTVGDNVEFVIEYKHPAETIVGIKKIK